MIRAMMVVLCMVIATPEIATQESDAGPLRNFFARRSEARQARRDGAGLFPRLAARRSASMAASGYADNCASGNCGVANGGYQFNAATCPCVANGGVCPCAANAIQQSQPAPNDNGETRAPRVDDYIDKPYANAIVPRRSTYNRGMVLQRFCTPGGGCYSVWVQR